MATDEQLARVQTMLDCCDDWDDYEQAAVEAVLSDHARLRKAINEIAELKAKVAGLEGAE